MRPAPTISAVLALALGLSACGGPGSSSAAGSPVDSGTFTLAVDGDPGALDPRFTDLSNTLQIDEFLYDSLLSIDPAGQLVPHLAAFAGSPTKVMLDATVLAVSGVPSEQVTSGRSVNVAVDPVVSHCCASGRARPLRAPGRHGHRRRRDRHDHGHLAHAGRVPRPQRRRAADRLRAGTGRPHPLRTGADDTGKYTVAEVVPGDRYVLTRRPDHAWAPSGAPALPGRLDTVVVRVIPNETTVANLLASGELSAAAVDGPDRQRLEAQELFRRDVLSMVGQLWFNQRPGTPAADEPVHRALVQALDLAQLTQVVTSGTGQPPASLVVPVFSPCEENTVAANLPALEPAAASAALDTAGWVAGPGGARQRSGAPLALTVFFQTSNGPAEQAAAELVAERWRELGIEVPTRAATDAEISQVVFAGGGAWDVAFAPLNATLPSQLTRSPRGHGRLPRPHQRGGSARPAGRRRGRRRTRPRLCHARGGGRTSGLRRRPAMVRTSTLTNVLWCPPGGLEQFFVEAGVSPVPGQRPEAWLPERI